MSHNFDRFFKKKNGFSQQVFVEVPIRYFTEIRPLGVAVIHVARRTYITKVLGAFCDFENALKKMSRCNFQQARNTGRPMWISHESSEVRVFYYRRAQKGLHTYLHITYLLTYSMGQSPY